MTKLSLIGNLTKDIEIEASTNGTKYAHLTIASDRGRGKDAATDVFRVSAIGDWVEDLRDLTKGTFCSVKANLKTSSYEGRTRIEIIAKSVERAAKESAA